MALTKELIKTTLHQSLKNFSAEEIEKCEELMNKVYLEGMPLKDAMELNDNFISYLYDFAYNLFMSGKFADARLLFEFLHRLEEDNVTYIMAIAACFHRENRYQEAIEMYTVASLLDPESYMPFHHMSDCFIQMNQPGAAIMMLVQVIKRTKGNASLEMIQQRAEMSIESLKSELEKTVS